jgi:hypothetical protein
VTFNFFTCALAVGIPLAGIATSALADPILDSEAACKYFLVETLKRNSVHPYRDFNYDLQLATERDEPELGRYHNVIWGSVSAVEGDWEDKEPLDGSRLGIFVEKKEVSMHVECLADLSDRRVLTIMISGSDIASEDQLPQLNQPYGEGFYPTISFDVGKDVHEGKY